MYSFVERIAINKFKNKYKIERLGRVVVRHCAQIFNFMVKVSIPSEELQQNARIVGRISSSLPSQRD